MEKEIRDYPFAVLGDNPLVPNPDRKDPLGFGAFVEPIARRIKSSLAQTPFTVAVLGPWGQGKSSLMKLLQHALERPSEGGGGPAPRVHCVWFEPWKYHSREEVWQGLALSLVQDVQKNSTLARELRRKRGPVTKAVAKGLWGALGGWVGWGDWGKDYLRKIVQIPLHLPKVAPGDFENYVGECLADSRVGEALSARWRPVLRRVCRENLREVKRFLNRFIADWAKAAANARRNAGQLGGAVEPARVAFVLAAGEVADGFIEYCQSGGFPVFERYQEAFLQEDASAASPAEAGEEERAFLENEEPRWLFQFCMGKAEADERLVQPFEDFLAFAPYFQFGHPAKEFGEASLVTPTPTVEAGVETPAASKAEPAAAKATEPEEAPEKGPMEEGAPRKEKRPSKELEQSLREARRDIGEGRARDVVERLAGRLRSTARVGDTETLTALAEPLGEAVVLTGEPSVLLDIGTDLEKAAEGAKGPAARTRSRLAVATVRGLWHARLRAVLTDSAAKLDEKLRGALEHAAASLADTRPGIGLDPDTGLPSLAWVPVQGVKELRLGSGLKADGEYHEDDEKWEGEDSLTVEPFLLTAYPVTVAQYRPFVEGGGYEPDGPWWTETGRKWLAGEKRSQPYIWAEPEGLLDNLPMVGVTWHEAVAYCRWLTARYREKELLGEREEVRLPTEAEWEWAARGRRVGARVPGGRCDAGSAGRVFLF